VLLCGIVLGFSLLTLLSINRIDGLQEDFSKMGEKKKRERQE